MQRHPRRPKLLDLEEGEKEIIDANYGCTDLGMRDRSLSAIGALHASAW